MYSNIKQQDSTMQNHNYFCTNLILLKSVGENEEKKEYLCYVDGNVIVNIAQSCPWNSPGQNTGGVAFPFSRGSSQPRDGIQFSHIAGRLFTS